MDSWAGIAALAILLPAAASLWLLSRLFQRHLDGQPLVPYVPRRRVPWTIVAPLTLLAPLALVVALPSAEDLTEGASQQVAAALQTSASAVAGASLAATAGCAVETAAVQYYDLRLEQRRMLRAIWSQVALFLLLLGACVLLLTKAFGANARDLGLPESWTQLRGDVALGIGACLAALVPVYSLHVLMTMLLEPDRGHPLIEELVIHPSPAMLIAGAMAAVVAAPLFEEVAFRLVFQGWLERSEDAALGLPEDVPVDRDAPGVVAGLRHGWAPILISAGAFGLAHSGQGAAPVAIVLLGAVLGYLYQRTHRIVPSIACHMTFNAVSLGSLILQLMLHSSS